ncbi:MAG: 2-dehydropantoate 2-reductase [Rhodovibrionaceae bacterium]|nr:2-dehydropantoate 2-reductase [Rhodovibrionaceae bacterium]
MKVCVFGVGAIGGILAAALHRGGAEVSLLARGRTLQSLTARGLRVVESGEGEPGEAAALQLPASDDPAHLGAQDVLVLALKAQQIEAALPAIAPLLGPTTAVLSAQNGIPWWYFHAHRGELTGTCLKSVDPSGRIADALPAQRVIGGILYLAAELVEPAYVRRAPGGRIVLGPAIPGDAHAGCASKTQRLAELLNAGGETAEVSSDILAAVWQKLWGNVAFNPVSALTGATLGEIAEDPGLRRLTRKVMQETQAVAERLGVAFTQDVDSRIDQAGRIGAHRSSMLQDLEAGRPPETGALMAAVSEIGAALGVPTPFLDATTALVEARARYRA